LSEKEGCAKREEEEAGETKPAPSGKEKDELKQISKRKKNKSIGSAKCNHKQSGQHAARNSNLFSHESKKGVKTVPRDSGLGGGRIDKQKGLTARGGIRPRKERCRLFVADSGKKCKGGDLLAWGGVAHRLRGTSGWERLKGNKNLL